MRPVGHHELVCPACKTRVGGCRCPGPHRQVNADAPCATCTAARHEAVLSDSDIVTMAGEAPAAGTDWLETDGGMSAPLAPMYDLSTPPISSILAKYADRWPTMIEDLAQNGWEIVPKIDLPKADCGHPNPLWSTTDDLWHVVMDPDGDADGVLCPACFVATAAQLGIRGTWHLEMGDGR